MPGTRYKVIHSYKKIQVYNKMWSKGIPVVFEKGNLLSDMLSGKTILFAKFCIIENKTISDLFIDIKCYDSLNNLAGVLEEFLYSGLEALQSDTFGMDTPAVLPYENIKKVEISIKRIIFDDGEAWVNSSDDSLEAVPKQQKLTDVLRPDLYSQFIREYKSKYELESQYSLAEYLPAETEDYWLCTCGQLNLPSNSLCCNCSCSKEFTFDYTKPATLSALLMQTYNEEQNQRTEQEIKKSHRNKKIVMWSKIIAAVTVAVIAIVFVNAKIIQPPIKYKDAKEAFGAGNYKQAASLLEKIPKYKDSDEIRTKAIQKIISTAKVGDIVRFGSYEQDNKKLNGKERIDWRILAVKNGKALLLSDKCLDYQPYDEFLSTSKDTYTLRVWLNDVFFNKAFTKIEQTVVADTKIYIEYKSINSKEGGRNTQDKVFLLSNEEAMACFASDEARQAYNTDYAEAKMGDSPYSEGESCTWWLNSYGCVVYPIGTIGTDYFSDNDENVGVRPAIWIDLKTQS